MHRHPFRIPRFTLSARHGGPVSPGSATRALAVLALAALALAALTLVWPGPAHGLDKPVARQLVVEQIELTGEPRTRLEVVERYLGLAAGSTLLSADLLTGRQRLEETGFYKSVDVYARPGSEKGLVVVVVELEEHTQPQYRFQGGHGRLDGWFIVPVSFVYDNPWGRGHRLDWQWYVGSHADGTKLHYQHPRLFGGAASLDVDLFSESRSFPQWVQGKRVRERVDIGGLHFRLAVQRGRLHNMFAEVRMQTYEPGRSDEVEPLLGRDLDEADVMVVCAGRRRDTRDHTGYPTRGFWGQVKVEQALSGSAGDVAFARLDAEGRWYRLLENRNVAAVRLHAGLVTKDAPFYERYYLGGPYSMRKFERAEATPVGWGTRTLQIQSELRLPFGREEAAGPVNTGVLFYDVGGIWLPGEVPLPADLEHDMGVGYRRRVPVLGVLRLDLSLPVVPTDGDTDWDGFHLWLTLGRTF